MGRNYPVLRGVGLNKTIKVNLITLPKFQGKGGGSDGVQSKAHA